MPLAQKNYIKPLSPWVFFLSFFLGSLQVFAGPPGEEFKQIYTKNFMQSCMQSYYRDPSLVAVSEDTFRRVCQCTLDEMLTWDVEELMELEENKESGKLEDLMNSCVNKALSI